MLLLEFPVQHEGWFYVIALSLSLALGIRAIFIQVHHVANENNGLKKQGLLEWSRGQRIIVHYFHDFLYNFTGSVVGWAAFHLLSYRMFLYAGAGIPPPPAGFIGVTPNLHLLSWPDLVLFVFALLGITAKLPQTVEGFVMSIAKTVETITGKLAK